MHPTVKQQKEMIKLALKLQSKTGFHSSVEIQYKLHHPPVFDIGFYESGPKATWSYFKTAEQVIAHICKRIKEVI